MMIKKTYRVITGALFTVIIFQIGNSHAEGTLSLTSGADYSSGKYGQSKATDITYIPFMAKYETDDTIIKLTVPWLEITGPGDVVGGNAPVVLGKSSRPITTESGLGDIVLTGTRTIARLGEERPLILDLTGKVKFATASASKGLGTGKNDYSIALDIYKPINTSATAFGDVGYKVMGDPNGVNLKNVWFGAAGVSYKFNPVTSAGFMVDTKQATQNTSTSSRELTIFLSHKFNDQYKLQSYITRGFSDASPDWGGGAMLAVTFN